MCLIQPNEKIWRRRKEKNKQNTPTTILFFTIKEKKKSIEPATTTEKCKWKNCRKMLESWLLKFEHRKISGNISYSTKLKATTTKTEEKKTIYSIMYSCTVPIFLFRYFLFCFVTFVCSLDYYYFFFSFFLFLSGC